MAATKSSAKTTAARPAMVAAYLASLSCDMGKSCLRFRTMDDLEIKSVAKVIGMVSPAQFFAHYKKVKGLE